jgi:hypothetical protein
VRSSIVPPCHVYRLVSLTLSLPPPSPSLSLPVLHTSYDSFCTTLPSNDAHHPLIRTPCIYIFYTRAARRECGEGGIIGRGVGGGGGTVTPHFYFLSLPHPAALLAVFLTPSCLVSFIIRDTLIQYTCHASAKNSSVTPHFVPPPPVAGRYKTKWQFIIPGNPNDSRFRPPSTPQSSW